MYSCFDKSPLRGFSMNHLNGWRYSTISSERRTMRLASSRLRGRLVRAIENSVHGTPSEITSKCPGENAAATDLVFGCHRKTRSECDSPTLGCRRRCRVVISVPSRAWLLRSRAWRKFFRPIASKRAFWLFYYYRCNRNERLVRYPKTNPEFFSSECLFPSNEHCH